MRAALYTLSYGIPMEFPHHHGGDKEWKVRKDAVEFLASVTSGGGPIFEFSNQQIIERKPHLKIDMDTMVHLSQFNPSDEIQGSSLNSDIVWAGDAWLCKQQLNHYPTYVRNNISISVYSFVWIMEAQSKASIGYVEDLYEDQQGGKMARVRRFLNPEDVESRFSKVCPQPREVFITSMEHKISVTCIDSVATVLMPSHFKKCAEFLPESLSLKSFLCHREIRNNSINTFSLSKLRGYLVQPILHALKCTVLGPSFNTPYSVDEAEVSGPKDPVTVPCSNFKAGQNDLAGECGPTSHRLQRKVLPRGDLAGKHTVPVRQFQGNVEVLSQDSGIRGCWFRCKILQSSKRRLMVQYFDVEDLEGSGKLEEWIPAHRIAAPDRLGIRCAGRLTVRPWPDTSPSNDRLEVGTAVDAWWCDGWWEGVVVGYDTSSENNLQVYLPGENLLRTVERKDTRVSKDWLENKWIDIRPKPDILSLLTSSFKPTSKPVLFPSQPQAHGTSAAMPAGMTSKGKATTSSGEQEKLLSAASQYKKAVEDLQLKERLSINETGKSSSATVIKNVGENEDGRGKSSSATASKNAGENVDGRGKSSSATASKNIGENEDGRGTSSSATASKNVGENKEGRGKHSSATAGMTVGKDEEGSGKHSTATACMNVGKVEEGTGKRSSTTARKNVRQVREIVQALPAVSSTGEFLDPQFNNLFKSRKGRKK